MNRFIALAIAMLCTAAMLPTIALSQEAYSVKPGDTIRIEVVEDPNLNRTVLVLPDGRISVPQAGTIQAAGRSVAEIQADIATRIAGNFAVMPNVFVGVDALAPRVPGTKRAPATDTVYIMGESANPGKYEVKRGSTLLQVLAESGGFSKFAATKRVQLRRGAKVYSFNYNAIESGTGTVNPIVITEGDVIIIPQRRLFE
jgi:polysaccharide biosynthesis/export protein